MRHAALKVIQLILGQGLVHPVQASQIFLCSLGLQSSVAYVLSNLNLISNSELMVEGVNHNIFFFLRLFDQELEYVERLLEEDIRNNSAWNQRFFVISHLHEKLEGTTLDQELKFTMTAIGKTKF